MSKPDFWTNKKNADSKMLKLSTLKNEVNTISNLSTEIKDNIDLTKVAKLENDELMKKELEKSILQMEKELNDLEIMILLNGQYDSFNCIMEIHSGAGGTEACDWALMLFRMYSRLFFRFCI